MLQITAVHHPSRTVVLASLLSLVYASAALAQSERGDAVALGEKHSCALAPSGRAYCWGSNSEGQLGRGSAKPKDAWAPAPVAGEFSFVSLTAGADHTCGLLADGTALCWGRGDEGQLGDGSRRASATPVRVSGAVRLRTADGTEVDSVYLGPIAFRKLDAGKEHTCGIARDGAAYCWGNAKSGRLGVPALPRVPGKCGGDPCATVPVRVEVEEPLVDIATSDDSSCGVGESGMAYCWGNNDHGQLGIGERGRKDIGMPKPVSSIERFVAVTAGAEHTCALTSDSRAFCWGLNSDGQLGDGTKEGGFRGRPEPVPVAGNFRFTSIDAKGGVSCGLTEPGQLLCWGSNDHNQLGFFVEKRGRQRTPALVSRVAFRAFAIGPHHACGFSHRNDLYCWGDDGNGRLGFDEDGEGRPGDLALVPRDIPEAKLRASAGSGEVVYAANGLPEYDEQLRQFLAGQQSDSVRLYAGFRVPGTPSDELVWALYQGAALRYSGDLARSSEALERAISLLTGSDQLSLSRIALTKFSGDRPDASFEARLAALLVNRATGPYQPAWVERAFVYYYYALNCMDAADRAGALRAAHALSAELAASESGTRATASERRMRSILAYFAGAVMEAAEDSSGARTAYRKAQALDGARDLPVAQPTKRGSGELVLVVERGFVAHRVPASISVPVTATELQALSAGEPEHRLEAARPLVAALSEVLNAQARKGLFHVAGADRMSLRRNGISPAASVDIPWSVFREEPAMAATASVAVSGGLPHPVGFTGDVSNAAVSEFETARPVLLARGLTVAALSEAATKEATDKASDALTLGNLIRGLATTAAAGPGRPDTRGWNLLPAEVGVIRLRLPAGVHRLTLALRLPDGSVRTEALDPVEVGAGRVTIAARRIWH